MDLIINQRADLLSIGELLLFILPSFMVISLPMAVLISVIVAFARLTADSETIVLQANGIGFFRWLIPVGIFSIFIYFSTLFLSFIAQPWGGKSLKNLTITMLRKQASLGLESGVFNDLFQNMVLYVNEITAPSKLRGILLFDFRQAGEPHLIIAQEGSIMDDPNSDLISFKLNRGSLHQKTKEQDSDERILFSTYQFTLDLGPMMADDSGQTEGNLTPQELRRRIAASNGQDLQAIRALEEHYKIYSFPTSCIFFGLIGVPLGMYAKRSGRLGGFAIGLVMVLGYYLLSALSDVMTSTRILPPLWAAWFPNIIFLVITAVLLISARGFFSFRRLFGRTTIRSLA
jgi:lipopolysaccharide export system permease protein